jgi:hypothetical protein
LTSVEATRKSKAVQKSSFYEEWRSRHCPPPCLREETAAPSEKLLQAIWLHQRIKRNELATLDGRPVQILHPGFWNREPGPDFRGAVLRINGDVLSKADVEIDLHSSGWKAHGHDINPAFTNVALHVVWEGEVRSQHPTLAIKHFLDAPLTDLSLWIGGDAETPSLAGQCSAPLKDLNEQQLTELLKQAAFVRFQDKARQFRARARNGGWEQALWEGLFRALGYKHNVWPMQRLAELREEMLRGAPHTLRHVQARLLGVAGLLPEELDAVHRSSAVYVRQLWDIWWRERDTYFDHLLPKAAWRFAGLRPANHPQRRLALASHWLANKNLVSGIHRWCSRKVPDSELLTSLHTLFRAADDFWPTHWTLRSAPLKRPQPLLGPPRLTDIAVNVVLPWLWSRAVEGNNLLMREEIERRFYAWPAGEDNIVLKLARRRLLDTSMRKLKRRAALQQGLLQVVRDFCEHSNALCQKCRFPELVRAWPR